MKDHIREERYIQLEGVVEAVIEEIREKSADLKEARIEDTSWGDYPDFQVVGWRPMNEKELAKAKAQRKREREQRKAQKEMKELLEREEYERLKEKYG
jgi:hypothetical protein